MLSISQTFIQPGRASARSSRKCQNFPTLSDDEDLNNVHQDEDYSKKFIKLFFKQHYQQYHEL